MSIEKNVPEIRFKGFGEEWCEIVIGNACSNFRSGKFIKAENIKKSGDYPVYGGNGLRGFTSEYNHDGTYALIGRQGALCGNMNYSCGKAFFTEHAIAVQANESNDTFFLYYKLGLMDLGQYSGQSAQPGLSVNKLTKLETLTPVKQEQTAIGNTFQKLDSLINQNQQKYDKLSNLKKAMLVKMFPKQGATIPEIRFKGFSGEWVEVKLGAIAKIKGRLGWKSLKQEEYLSYGPAMIAGKHIDKGIINWKAVDHIPNWRYLESPEIMLKNDDVIFSKDGSLGNPAIIADLQCEATINSTMMLVRPTPKLKSKFFYQVLQTKVFRDLIKEKVSGSSIPHLFQADMKLFSFRTPDPVEQEAIGNYFQKLDTLINQYQRKIIKLNNIKQACLSKMFV